MAPDWLALKYLHVPLCFGSQAEANPTISVKPTSEESEIMILLSR